MSAVIDWAKAHPRLTAWIVLALGMDGMVAYEARSVGLQPMQWVALIVATTLVAGLCVWIIGWEDEEDTAQTGGAQPAAPAAPLAAPAKPVARKPAAKKVPAKRTTAKKTKRK